jgi:hypothetical protein
MKCIFVLIPLLFLVGCTDARWDKITALGDRAKITCYSGGVVIYSGESTGKLLETESSDGYNLRDSKTGGLVQVDGDCIVVYQE